MQRSSVISDQCKRLAWRLSDYSDNSDYFDVKARSGSVKVREWTSRKGLSDPLRRSQPPVQRRSHPNPPLTPLFPAERGYGPARRLLAGVNLGDMGNLCNVSDLSDLRSQTGCRWRRARSNRKSHSNRASRLWPGCCRCRKRPPARVAVHSSGGGRCGTGLPAVLRVAEAKFLCAGRDWRAQRFLGLPADFTVNSSSTESSSSRSSRTPITKVSGSPAGVATVGVP